jgi:hypothetical protein
LARNKLKDKLTGSRRYQRYKEAGQYPRCLEPATPGKVMCAASLCAVCGLRDPEPGRTRCRQCRVEYKLAQAVRAARKLQRKEGEGNGDDLRKLGNGQD